MKITRTFYLKAGTGNDWAGQSMAMLSLIITRRRFVSSAEVIFGLTLPTGSTNRMSILKYL